MTNDTISEVSFVDNNNHGGLILSNANNESPSSQHTTNDKTEDSNDESKQDIPTSSELTEVSETNEHGKNEATESVIENVSTTSSIPPTTDKSRTTVFNDIPNVDYNLDQAPDNFPNNRKDTSTIIPDKDDNSTKIIIISILGVIIVIVVIIIVLMCFCRNRKSKKFIKNKKKLKKKSKKYEAEKLKRKNKSPVLDNIPNNGIIGDIKNYNLQHQNNVQQQNGYQNMFQQQNGYQSNMQQQNAYSRSMDNPIIANQNQNQNMPTNVQDFQNFSTQNHKNVLHGIANNKNDSQNPLHQQVNYPPTDSLNIQPIAKTFNESNQIPSYGTYKTKDEFTVKKCACNNGKTLDQVIFISHGDNNWRRREDNDTLSCFSFQISSNYSINNKKI